MGLLAEARAAPKHPCWESSVQQGRLLLAFSSTSACAIAAVRELHTSGWQVAATSLAPSHLILREQTGLLQASTQDLRETVASAQILHYRHHKGYQTEKAKAVEMAVSKASALQT